MKNIAFSTSGLDLDAPMDPRFGRAAGFLLFNTDDGTLQHIENLQARNASQRFNSQGGP